MISPSPDGIQGTKATLPSGSVDNTVGGFNWSDWAIWSYENSDLKSWFGDNDYQNDKGAGVGTYTNARKAHFKDASFTYDAANPGWYYWTRSPVAGYTFKAWGVFGAGDLSHGNVHNSAVAARPACFLNQELIIFKSASNDFDLGSNPAGEAGSAENPYLLVLPSEIPNGAPSGWTTEFVSVTKTPDGAVINGKNMIVSWDVDILPAVKRWPAPGDFKLSTGESPVSVTSDDANPKLLKLTFATGVTAGATVTLSYNLNTDAVSYYEAYGVTARVVDSFAAFEVINNMPSGGGGVVTPNVIPPQALFDGLAPADLKFLLSGAALTAANAGNLSIIDETPGGTSLLLAAGDYGCESRNLTLLQTFLSKLEDGTHTIYLYNGETRVGKVTLVVTDSTDGEAQGSGSSGCNAGAGTAVLLAMGIVVLGLNKAGMRKKK